MSRIGRRTAALAGGLAFASGLGLATGVTSTLASTNGSLTSDDRSLHTGVGTYTDCSGHTPLQSDEAALDSCIPGRSYFLGHNVGVFTPLLHMRVGDHIMWTAPQGDQHRLRIVAVRDWTASRGAPPVSRRDVAAQFQTCIRQDGSVDRILDAVEEGP